MDVDIIRYCGWDIGGAHIKFAGLTGDGKLIAVEQQKCPLWLGVDHLCKVIDTVQRKFNLTKAVHAVTMTGELCDSFLDRQTGVECIANAISTKLDPSRVALYGLGNSWRELHDLEGAAADIASANWYASASFVAKYCSDAIVMDLGSTTLDIIPIVDSKIATKGRDDFSRLKYRELVYTGIVRTPLSSIVRALPFEGDMIPLAAECFATSADVYRSLNLLPEHADLYAAADGGEKSKQGSARRLFRMIGRDFNISENISENVPGDAAQKDGWADGENDDRGEADEWDATLSMARYAFDEQLKQIKAGLEFVLAEHQWNRRIVMVGLGCGAHIVEKLCADIGFEYCDFDSLINLGPDQISGQVDSQVGRENSGQASRDTVAHVCAPAVAVAYLLRADGRLEAIE